VWKRILTSAKTALATPPLLPLVNKIAHAKQVLKAPPAKQTSTSVSQTMEKGPAIMVQHAQTATTIPTSILVLLRAHAQPMLITNFSGMEACVKTM